jgi:hypothetical protein
VTAVVFSIGICPKPQKLQMLLYRRLGYSNIGTNRLVSCIEMHTHLIKIAEAAVAFIVGNSILEMWE